MFKIKIPCLLVKFLNNIKIYGEYLQIFGLFITHYFTNFPSRSNSRATTPERSITRQVSSVSSVSNDSNESNTAIGKKGDPSEKLALQKELIELKKRSDELQSILGANKRTISTRVCITLLPIPELF